MRSCLIMSNSLQPRGLWSARLLCPWDSPGRNIREGCHFLLQDIITTQGMNLGLPHCRQPLYLSCQGSPGVRKNRLKLTEEEETQKMTKDLQGSGFPCSIVTKECSNLTFVEGYIQTVHGWPAIGLKYLH